MSKFPDGKLTTVKLINGEAATMLATLDTGSIQCCITSPPYYGLRDYDDPDQLGLEKMPDEYVARLVDVFREVRRVLRDDGTVWLNLGDSYAGGGGGNYSKSVKQTAHGEHITNVRNRSDWLTAANLKPKDLIGIPWRVAFALQADGWILRSDIIWEKPNPMPESVDDRPTKAHEYLFLLAKQGRYYYDKDAIREPNAPPNGGRQRAALNGSYRYKDSRFKDTADVGNGFRNDGLYRSAINPLGRNHRDVWTIASKPFPGAHFAVMPPALVEPCILAGTSERGCCPACRAPQIKVWAEDEPSLKIGWAPSCSCPAHEPIPCTVIDPYCGSGTVGAVAVAHERSFVGIDLKAEYLEMSRNRINDARRGNLYRPRTGSKADGSMPLFGE